MGGGGDGEERGGPPPTGIVDCQALRIDTVLLSPDVARLGKLSIGDQLDVRAITQGKVTVIGICDESGPIGYVSSAELGRLLRCIVDGYKYGAEVMRVEGAECRVRIKHRTI